MKTLTLGIVAAVSVTIAAAQSSRIVWSDTRAGVESAIVRVLDAKRKELVRLETTKEGAFDLPANLDEAHILAVSVLTFKAVGATERLWEYPFSPNGIKEIQIGRKTWNKVSLRGKIVVPGEELSGAEVQVVTDTKYQMGESTFSDEKGEFTFFDLKPGIYNVVAFTHHGTALKQAKVNVPGEETLILTKATTVDRGR